jgi:hypothetical protein
VPLRPAIDGSRGEDPNKAKQAPEEAERAQPLLARCGIAAIAR